MDVHGKELKFSDSIVDKENLTAKKDPSIA